MGGAFEDKEILSVALSGRPTPVSEHIFIIKYNKLVQKGLTTFQLSTTRYLVIVDVRPKGSKIIGGLRRST